LALVHKAVAGFQVDSAYLGEAEGKNAESSESDMDQQDLIDVQA